jgi:hypothetical protein
VEKKEEEAYTKWLQFHIHPSPLPSEALFLSPLAGVAFFLWKYVV